MENNRNRERTFVFFKFDGAGNDFVLIDARACDPQFTTEQIAHICHRRFGVGADGLMTLGNGPEGYDFRMVYYNSDGREAEMCGNGGRCIAMFAHLMGLGRMEGGRKTLRFIATDGPHEAVVLDWDDRSGNGEVALSMRDVPNSEVKTVLDGHLLNTGVPHYVQEVADLDNFDVVGEGRRLRHHPAMGPEGANVNFVEPQPDGSLKVRTYERGVEDETWACGTGVTACSIVTGCSSIQARGGRFSVDYLATPEAFTRVVLTGPVSLNFDGSFSL